MPGWRMEARRTVHMRTHLEARSLRRLLFVVVLLVSFAAVAQNGCAASNAIVVENQQPGTTSWQFTNFNKAQNHEIEGYASLTSVNQGGQIGFMVSLSG